MKRLNFEFDDNYENVNNYYTCLVEWFIESGRHINCFGTDVYEIDGFFYVVEHNKKRENQETLCFELFSEAMLYIFDKLECEENSRIKKPGFMMYIHFIMSVIRRKFLGQTIISIEYIKVYLDSKIRQEKFTKCIKQKYSSLECDDRPVAV